MITENTYRSSSFKTDTMGQILSTFSALDETVQQQLNHEAIRESFSKLVVKLASFCYLHGDEVPHNFINSIFNAEEVEAFEVANHFLEVGNYDTKNSASRELQQEILHFSRIVDLEKLDETTGTKRIRRSQFIEDFLKVYAELTTVMRSRLIQREKSADIPISPSPRAFTEEINKGVFINTLNKDETNYLTIIQSDKRRLAKDLTYQYTSLLSYLTPPEALYALINYIIEMDFSNDISMCLIYNSEKKGRPVVIRWESSINNTEETLKNQIKWCLEKLPNVYYIDSIESPQNDILVGETRIRILDRSENQVSLKLLSLSGADDSLPREFIIQQFNRRHLSSFQFFHKSLSLLKENNIYRDIVSIESGHIHLDRQIDCDQNTGFEIGKKAFEYFSEVQTFKPLMCPMVDDDHVMIALKPKDYENYMCQIMPNIDYELIPESSPIIRSIVVELYHRIINSNLNSKIKRMGSNLYIKIDNNTTCEIFEDFEGRCDTGCVLFEVALLIYRTNPQLFKDYFNETFNLKYDVHSYILEVLNRDVSHDEKYKILSEFREQFKKVLNPKNRQEKLKNIIENLFFNSTFNHLNVLEDYYEHQQDKVRKLIGGLNIPICLFSLHFNTQTGRVDLKGGSYGILSQNNEFRKEAA